MPDTPHYTTQDFLELVAGAFVHGECENRCGWDPDDEIRDVCPKCGAPVFVATAEDAIETMHQWIATARQVLDAQHAGSRRGAGVEL